MTLSGSKEAQVRECCTRILETSSFASSPRLCSFLKYIVDLSLAGRTSDIKEYAIGIDVFDRTADFDPKSDPIVRVQARRLRQKLGEYYETAGNDSVRIDVPKGTYIPVFLFLSTPDTGNTKLPTQASIVIRPFLSSRTRLFLLAFALVASLTLLLGLGSRWNSGGPKSSHRQLQRLTHDFALQPALSPDGKWVAYSSDRAREGYSDIWIQPVSGGQAVRLTRFPHQEWTPSFSPDGASVLFWYAAAHDGLPEEGLYTVPIIGGEPRKIVGGRAGNPRVSPDGNWIAYTGGTARRNVLSIVAPTGGSPKQVTPEFASSGFPAWLPDGKIIFWGALDTRDKLLDWWVVPATGGPPVRTGAVQELLNQGVIEQGKATGDFWPSAWFDGRIVFRAGRSDDSQHIWSIPLNLESSRVEGPVRQETFGGAREVLPAVSDDGTMVFCGQQLSRDFWTVPLEANSGRPLSNSLQKATRNSASDGIGIFTRNGSSVVFNTIRNNGNADIYRIDLDGSGEKPVIATSAPEFLSGLSSDGSQVLYESRETDQITLCVRSGETDIPQKICAGCAGVITPDGSRVYFSEARRVKGARVVSVFDLATRQQRVAFTVEAGICFPCPTSRFSRDGRWFAALRTGGQTTGIVLLPVPDVSSSHDRKAVVVGGNGDASTNWLIAGSLFDWSPDGKLVYFASDRDGYRCIWAQRVHANTRTPEGEPFAVYHNHQRNSRNLASLTILRDRLVLGLPIGTSDIWLTKLK